MSKTQSGASSGAHEFASDLEDATSRPTSTSDPGPSPRQCSIKAGDRVTWKGSDADIPAGMVGRVVRVLSKNGEVNVEVSFPSPAGSWSCR
eukprot:CAMPEP_0172636562 /NCGR_PEP_ID=MMETSP1068-20121228/204617_1 /TAXON_ID=35684 /ORGANISM="Pseudopedinella elastica, Strain CCMP716" /LENGTH=90 /DNA_ID=CAMNT_0013449013 /DNA_START=24 /DNA_END=292 /DNA_ORIENTATION=-